MVKRVMSLLVTLVLLASMVACASGGDASSGASTPDQSSTPASQSAAPASQESEPVKKIFQGAASGGQARCIESSAARFKEKTGIEVEALVLPHTELRQKIILELRSGTALFDMVPVNGPEWYVDMVDYLEPLTPYIERSDGLPMDIDSFVPAMLDQGKVNGVQMGLPFRIGPEVLMYRKDLFEAKGLEPPKTIDDFINCAKVLTEGDVYGFAPPLMQSYILMSRWLSWLYTFNGTILNEDMTECTFNSPEGVKALQFYMDLVNVHKVVSPAAFEYEQEGTVAAMQQGLAAMSVVYAPYYLDLNDPTKSEFAGNFAVAPYMPYDPATGRTKGRTSITGWSLSIPKDSKNKDAAWEFIKFCTSPEEQRELGLNYSNMPSVSAIYDDPDYLAIYPDAPNVESAAEGAVVRPATPYWTLIEDVLTRELSAAIMGEKTAEQALNDAAAEINSAMK